MLVPLSAAEVGVEALLGMIPVYRRLVVDTRSSVVAVAAEVARPVAVDSMTAAGTAALATAALASALGKSADIVAAVAAEAVAAEVVAVEAVAGRTLVAAEEEVGIG